MSVSIRIRNGMAPSGGSGGATEGDIRGDIADSIFSLGGVVNLTLGHLLVHQSVTPAMNVIVDAGIGYIPNGSFDELDSDQIKFWEAVVAGTEASRTLTIGANSSGQTRIDVIALKMDTGIVPDQNAANVASLVVVTGTPGAGVPATPASHLALAQVTVANGASSIANAVITDVRTQLMFKDWFENGVTVSLTDGATPAVNAALSKFFLLTAAGDRTIGIPSNPTPNRVMVITHLASGADRTLSLNTGTGGFLFGSTVTGLTPTISGKRDLIGSIYNSVLNKWLVVSYTKGF